MAAGRTMDTSGTGCDAAAAMEGLTVEGLSARQLEVMQQLLESQLKVERERMQRMLAAERNAIRQEVVEALAARGLEDSRAWRSRTRSSRRPVSRTAPTT